MKAPCEHIVFVPFSSLSHDFLLLQAANINMLLLCVCLFALSSGSLNLEGKFQREVVDNVDAGVVYKFNE